MIKSKGISCEYDKICFVQSSSNYLMKDVREELTWDGEEDG